MTSQTCAGRCASGWTAAAPGCRIVGVHGVLVYPGGVHGWCTQATLLYPGVLPGPYYPALCTTLPCVLVGAVHTGGSCVYTAQVVRGAVLSSCPL